MTKLTKDAGVDERAKEERSLTQAEAIARILEFVGKEGKPLKQVFEYAVKGLGLRRPEPLLKELLAVQGRKKAYR
jgi:hypothetical protein